MYFFNLCVFLLFKMYGVCFFLLCFAVKVQERVHFFIEKVPVRAPVMLHSITHFLLNGKQNCNGEQCHSTLANLPN